MPKIDYCNDRTSKVRNALPGLLLLCLVLPALAFGAEQGAYNENLSGYYAREGNGGSPAQAAGNNIYIRFFADRWLGMLFLPYPYAESVDEAAIARVFDAARAKTSSSAYLRGTFGELEEKATLHIERYGYIEDRVIFECGSLAPCTIKLGDGYLELIKPGVINEHIIHYQHVAID
ncbi:MAG: hypothetical protein GY875_04190 [Gammaproteobacteria bacterium]|nr:hypothetical protein [Gammaproteobacteria bacterium]